MGFDRGVTADLVDLPALRSYLVAHAVPGLDEVVLSTDGSSVHRRLVVVDGAQPVLLTVALPSGDVGSPTVTVDGSWDDVGPVLATGRRWVGLDADPAPGVAALAGDPVLGPLVVSRPHLRVPGSTDAFETAVLVVLGQHVSLAAGRVFAARLVAAHGGHLGTQLGQLRVFPGPQVLARLDGVDLQRTVGITGARARTVVAIAREVADGNAPLASRDAMLALPGIGPWTADLVALRALRDPDVFLPGDLVLRKALGGLPAARAAAMAEAWSPHRSLAVLHLWTHHAIDPPR